MSTSIIIEYQNQDLITKQKSITDINPLASGQELINFSQGIVSLVGGNYIDTTKIDKTKVNNLQARTVDQFSIRYDSNTFTAITNKTITIPKNNFNTTNNTNNVDIRFFTTNNSAIPIIKMSTTADTNTVYPVVATQYYNYNSSTTYVPIEIRTYIRKNESGQVPEPQVITAEIIIPANNGYDTWSDTVTIIISEGE